MCPIVIYLLNFCIPKSYGLWDAVNLRTTALNFEGVLNCYPCMGSLGPKGLRTPALYSSMMPTGAFLERGRKKKCQPQGGD